MISNSLDIDYIHGEIHGGSSKEIVAVMALRSGVYV